MPGDTGHAVLRKVIFSLFSLSTFFGSYLRSLFSATSESSVDSSPLSARKSNTLLPIPVPWFSPPPLSAWRRQSSRARGASVPPVTSWNLVDALVGVALAALSFLMLGCPPEAPLACRAARPPEFEALTTRQQREFVLRVRKDVLGLVQRFRSLSLCDENAGRKASSIRKNLSVIGDLCAESRRVLASYSHFSSRPEAATPAPPVPQKKSQERAPRPGGRGPLLVDIDRIKLPPPGVVGTFCLEKYLPPGVREAFLDPKLLQFPSARPHDPIPKTRIYAKDFLAILYGLSNAGMLRLEVDNDVPRGPRGEDLACGLFAVPKSASEDRMITDRRAANSLEVNIGAVKELFPHASQVAEIILDKHEMLIAHGDDLPHYYFTIAVPYKRARYNQIGPALSLDRLHGTSAYDEFKILQKLRDLHWYGCTPLRDDDDSVMVRALQSTLPMGDRSATDFGHVGHLNVLRRAGGADLSELVSYQRPFPLGQTHQWVCVDDHCVTQVVDRNAPTMPGDAPADRRDVVLLRRAEHGYRRAKLKTVDKKRFRGQRNFQLLGAAVEGEAGWVAAKPGLLLLFAGLVQNILSSGRVWGAALATAAGLWSHACMFRREAFSVVDLLFREIGRLGAAGHRVDRVHPGAIDELAVAVCLLPMLGTSLRADVSTDLICTDACGGAKAGAGCVRSRVPRELARRLWRHRLRRGGYVFLENALGGWCRDWLHEHGYFNAEDNADRNPHLGTRFFGDIADGLSWKNMFGFRIRDSPHINFGEHIACGSAVIADIRGHGGSRKILVGLDSDVVAHVVAKGRSSSRKLNKLQRRLAAQLMFAEVHVGPLRISSLQNPADDPSRGRPVREGPRSEVSEWAREVIRGDLSLLSDHLDRDEREVWFQQPGARGRKGPPPQYVPPLPGSDEWARARARGGTWVPSAEEEPILATLARYVPVGRRRGDDNSLCGDGPRAVRARRTETSLLGPLVQPKEAQLRDKQFDEFLVFAHQEGIDESNLWASPVIMNQALRLFGQHLWQTQRSRGDYARLVHAVRDRRGDWATMLRPAWDLDRKWQSEEPVTHRTPLPANIWRAAVVVALLQGKIAFAVGLLLGFCCALRPGELFNLKRRCLLLPEDLALDDAVAYIVIEKPKTRNRAARTQHVVLRDALVLRFLSWFVLGLELSDKVIPLSSHFFLRSWREVFNVLHSTAFSPGSLRAGAASELYKQCADLNLIRWLLRHSSQGSLESYIQELPYALLDARPSPMTREAIASFGAAFVAALAEAPLGVFGPPRVDQPRPARAAAPRRRRARRSARDQLACSLNGAFWRTAAVQSHLPPDTRGTIWLAIEDSDDSFSDDSE